MHSFSMVVHRLWPPLFPQYIPVQALDIVFGELHTLVYERFLGIQTIITML